MVILFDVVDIVTVDVGAMPLVTKFTPDTSIPVRFVM
jgi:hypothetical protein